jgi:hypothetical protein
MKIGVVGSRDYPDLEEVWRFVETLPPGTTIISGGGGDVDKTAEGAADHAGLHKIIHHAKWEVHGKRAGFERNPLIVRDSDRIVAFLAPCKKCVSAKECPYHGWSHGASNTLALARAEGKPTTTFTADLRSRPQSAKPGD